jgi:hypothetical protein
LYTIAHFYAFLFIYVSKSVYSFVKNKNKNQFIPHFEHEKLFFNYKASISPGECCLILTFKHFKQLEFYNPAPMVAATTIKK